MRMNLKRQVADVIDDAMKGVAKELVEKGFQNPEITNITPTQWQIKVWPPQTGAPRYFLIKMSEMM